MFSNLKNIFKVEDLRKKVFFTLAMIMVYRFGAGLRVPGIDARLLRSCAKHPNHKVHLVS